MTIHPSIRVFALSSALFVAGGLYAEDGALLRAFEKPPAAARPWAWWFWANGHISANGIRADLAAMKEAGLAGINLFNAAPAVPPGPVRFLSPEWNQMMRLVGNEVKRNDLSMIMLNCAGWSGSGGPWVKIEDSMQMLVWSEVSVEDRTEASPILLPVPPHLEQHYGDIAVLAFPASPEPAFPSPRVTSNVYGLAGEHLVDGNENTKVVLPTPGDGHWIRLDYGQPITASSFTFISGQPARAGRTWIIFDALDADGSWREVGRMDVGVWRTQLYPTTSATFAPATAASWRIRWQAEEFPAVGGKPPIIVADLKLQAVPRIHDWEFRTGHARRWGHDGGWRDTPTAAYEALSPSSIISLESIVDLTSHLQSDGRLNWAPPPGRWTILRIGHTTNGARVSPAPAGGEGWEPDILNPNSHGVDEVFSHYLDPLLGPDGADLQGKLNGVEMDSWEMSTQTWTPRLPEIFRTHHGYDLRPWLVVSAGGRIVESPRESERYLWDMRRTLADMIAENYYGHMAERLHQRGLTFYAEACGAQQFLYDPINYFRSVDVPMGEFWANATGPRADCKLAASAAQLYDRPVVAAESFTSPGGWKESPRTLKPLADAAFVAGINRIKIASYIHQPWPDDTPGVAPGATLGPWGIDYNRFTTWWRPGFAFVDYLARCSAMLQSGRFVGDVLYLLDEGAPNGLGYEPGPFRQKVPGVLPSGYDFTVTDLRALRERVTVSNGRLMLPNGASYRLLVLPDSRQFTPEGLKVIADLVHAGASIIGPKPLGSPSRRGGTQADMTVRALANQLWGDGDNVPEAGHRYGEGRVYARSSLGDVLRQLHVAPDLAWTGAGPDDLDYIHREREGTDVYFVINRTAAEATIAANFRVAGRTPELWNPEDGTRRDAPIFRTLQDQTEVPLTLPPYGSVFVVFQKPATRLHYVDARGSTGMIADLEVAKPGPYELRLSDGSALTTHVAALPSAQSLVGPWQVEFQARAQPPFQARFERLQDWAESVDERVKYFSGTAIYTTTFACPSEVRPVEQRVWLDLGRVEVMAEITLNGKKLGVLWRPPYRVDVTEVLRPGLNELRVAVTNLWINRLIGDEREPADADYTAGGALRSVPGWLTTGTPRPTKRQTFTFWHHYKIDDPLFPSGLLGPMQLETNARLPTGFDSRKN